jgi:hypothetical protein
MKAALTRRSFVVAATSATALVAGSGVPVMAQAKSFAAPLALIDARIAKTSPDRGILLGDLVRQWQNGLRERVAASGAVALVRWDMALMLRQLGREARLSIKVAPRAGGVFGVDISARCAPQPSLSTSEDASCSEK